MSIQRAPEPQSLDSVRDWFETMLDALVVYRAQVVSVVGAAVLPATSRFFGMSVDEVDAFLTLQRAELEFAASLSMLASAEATIRADYEARVSKKLKDKLSREYRALQKRTGVKNRPPFDDGILEILKRLGVIPGHLVSAFRDVLGLRHWLAHGRHWPLKLGHHAHAPDDVYRTIHALVSALPPV